MQLCAAPPSCISAPTTCLTGGILRTGKTTLPILSMFTDAANWKGSERRSDTVQVLVCLPPAAASPVSLPPTCSSLILSVVCAAAALILRVPILFGEVESVSESAVTCLWIRVQDTTESCTLDHCQQRFPTDTRDVAAVCRKLCERARQVGCRPLERATRLSLCLPGRLTACRCLLQEPSISGIFHFSSNQQMTKYEMGVSMARAFNLPCDHLIPVNINTVCMSMDCCFTPFFCPLCPVWP